jgi:hypothetical protein
MSIEEYNDINDLKGLINTDENNEMESVSSSIELKPTKKKYNRTTPFEFTEKRQSNLKKAIETKKKNYEERLKKRNEEEALRQKELEEKILKKATRIKNRQQKENKLLEVSDDDEEANEEQIIIKKKKAKKKVIVIEESDEDEPIVIKTKKEPVKKLPPRQIPQFVYY